jgi:formylglycine-generating enzyme required for sulfatase activity
MDAISIIWGLGAVTLVLLAAAYRSHAEAAQRTLAYGAVACATTTAAFVLDVGAHTRFTRPAAMPQDLMVPPERDCPSCPLLTAIPAGYLTVVRGTEEPVTVRIWPGFAVSRSEISESEFNAFARATGRSRSVCAPTPHDRAICVTRGDAEAYTAWLTRMTGRSYRLMTAVEWSHAAQSATGARRPLLGLQDDISEIVDDCQGACAAAGDRRHTVSHAPPSRNIGFRVLRLYDLAL